jgi:uncharacterized membrane protein YeaQ/YmgE (transglycosylase-associated protein family)
MWSNLAVFALIGLFAGGTSRLFYPGRRPTRIVGTMVIGMLGAVGAGMISWNWWPAVAGQFYTGNLIMSILGAMILIVLWAAAVYKRSLVGYGNKPQ